MAPPDRLPTPPYSMKRKASISSLSSQVPKPLRVFKKASRKLSFQQLPQYTPDALALTSVEEPLSSGPRHVSFLSSANCQLSAVDPCIGGNSSLTLLPTPEASDAGDDVRNEDIDDGLCWKRKHDRVPLLPKMASSSAFAIATDRLRRRASNLNPKFAANFISQCAICKVLLKSSMKTYAFPRTAPAVLATLRTLQTDFQPSLFGAPATRLTPIKTSSSAYGGNGIKKRNFVYLSPFHPSSSSQTLRTINPDSLVDSLDWPAAPRPRSPEFCHACFQYLHSLHICWTCGEEIKRAEERIGCGWAWWHWGCVCCLLCRAPVTPPKWTNRPITLPESPACRACLRELRDLVAIERRKISDCRWTCDSPLPNPDARVAGNDLFIPKTRKGPGDSNFTAHCTISGLEDTTCVIGDDHKRDLSGKSNSPRTGIFFVQNRADTILMKERKTKEHENGAKDAADVQSIHSEKRRSSGAPLSRRNPSGDINSRVADGSRISRRYVYPPLPKWMEKLPGRRGDAGAIAGASVGADNSFAISTGRRIAVV